MCSTSTRLVVLASAVICLIAATNIYAAESYDLSGKWDAVITRHGNDPDSMTVERDVITITQNGKEVVGAVNNNGKFFSKGDNIFKGVAKEGALSEVFVSFVVDPTVFSLGWFEGEAKLDKIGSALHIISRNKDSGWRRSIALIKK